MKRIRYWFWKRHAKKAIRIGLTTSCVICDDPIVPGDFVGIGRDDLGEDAKEVLVHAGFHFSLSEMTAFCETGAIGCAYWDGKRAVGTGESLVSKVIKTGEAQVL